MKVKLQAGAELDFLTQGEMESVLQNWLQEIKRGVRFVRRPAQAIVDAGGLVLIQDQDMGPAGSIVWALTRVSVANLDAGDIISIYVNEVAPSAFLGRVLETQGSVLTLPGPALPLNPLDRLIFTGSGLTVGAQISVNVQAVELPVQLAWQLI